MSNTYYALDTKASLKMNARLLYITRAGYGEDWASLMHIHSCAELFYVIQGSGAFLLGEKSFPIKQDDLIIVNPNVEHTETSANKKPLEYIVLGIDGLEFLFSEEHDTRYSLSNYRKEREEFTFYLNALLKEVETKSVSYETICQNLLEILLVKIMQHTSFSTTISASKKSNKECAAVKRYIDANYRESITLDSLADIAHVNKYYLVHAFHNETGVSPITYLIRRRIRESKYLLGNTNYTLSQISQTLSFSSQSYFSQSFKTQEGISPNEYRKRARQKAELDSKAEDGSGA